MYKKKNKVQDIVYKRKRVPKAKKIEKKCWQKENDVVECNSCQRESEQKPHSWAKNHILSLKVEKRFWKKSKKDLTNRTRCDIINELLESNSLYIEKWTVWVLESV